MKRFILKVSFFLLPILVSAISMEVLLRNIPNDYLYKSEYLDEHSPEIETLILGSSHSYRGLNPEYFASNTFNAGYVTQTFNFDYEILKKYQGSFNNLKTIILPISYHSFYAKLESGGPGESWRIKNYVIYCGMDTMGSFVDRFEVLAIHPKVNVKRLGSYYIKGTQQLTCTKLGWGKRNDSKNGKDLVEAGKITAKRHTRSNIYSEKFNDIFIDNKLILDSIVKWCRKQNINILLLTLPAFETYRQNISPEQYDVTIEAANKFASEYNNCIYLNLFNDTSFIAKDFYDADHLSETGAKKLSKLIDKKINEWNN